MKNNPQKQTRSKELVLIGGGHAHVYLLKELGTVKYQTLLQQHNIHVTLVSKDVHTPYSGMLPGYVAGHYSFAEMHIDLQQLCDASHIPLIHGACTAITTEKNQRGGGTIEIELDSSHKTTSIRYDAVSIDVGSAPSVLDSNILQHPHVIPVKPISNFCRYWEQLKRSVQDDTTQKERILCVVGGGAGGVELILSLQYALQQQQPQNNHNSTIHNMVLVTRGQTLLEGHNAGVQRRMRRILQERNVQVHLNCTVTGVETLQNDDTGRSQLLIQQDNDNNPPPVIWFDDCLWCTSAGAPSWLAEHTPFPTHEGFLHIDDTYQVHHHPGVFAAGDCCHNPVHPRPKAGVFAVRAGPPLLANVLTYLTSLDDSTSTVQLTPHIPQTTFLGILSTGDKYAVASKGNWLSLEGAWVWKWKDYLDRTWIQEYQQVCCEGVTKEQQEEQEQDQ